MSFSELRLGAFGKTAGTAINSAVGRSVRFLRGGVSGTTLGEWAASASPQRAALVSAIKAAGGVDAILVQVGRNDAANLVVGSTETQATLIRSLISSLRSEANVPSATVFIGGSQDILGGTTDQHLQLGRQRLAEINVANSESMVRYGFSTYDLPTVDQIHQSEASQLRSGMRFAAQVIALLQGTSQKRGPQISGVTLVDQSHTDVRLTHGAGTDISPTENIDGFQTFLAGTTTELTITAAQRLSSTVVRLSHQPRGNQAVQLAYALYRDVDDLSCLRDNSADALPGEPFASPQL